MECYDGDMIRFTAALLLAPLMAAAQPDTNGLNAANIYWPALSNIAAWAGTYTNAGMYPATNAASPDAARAYADLLPQLAGLAAAGEATYCNWGTRFEDGPAARLPYIGPALRSARASLWAADYALSNGLPGFADRAMDALRLSRNAGEDQLLISYLVQISGEKPALELLARNVDQLDARQFESLAAQLDNLPPGATLVDAARMEKAMFVDQLVNRMLQAMREADTNLFDVIPASFAPGDSIAPAGAGESWLAKNLRLASVVQNGLNLWIGFETPQGESFTVARGRPSHGIELLSADVARGEALIARGQETALVKLQSREIAPIRLAFRVKPDGVFGELMRGRGEDLTAEEQRQLSTPEGLLAALRMTGEEYARWTEAVEKMPLEEFRPWQKSLMKHGTVFTRLLLPAMDKAMEKERELLEARAKLDAAIAARRSHQPAAAR